MMEPETLTPVSRPVIFCTPSVAVSPVSTSLAPANISRVNDAASSAAPPVRAAATNGLSLVPVTVTVTTCVAVAPKSSVTVAVNVSVTLAPSANASVSALLSVYVQAPVVGIMAKLP